MKLVTVLSTLATTVLASSNCIGYIGVYPQANVDVQSLSGTEAQLVLADSLGLAGALNGADLANKEFVFALPQKVLGSVDTNEVIFTDILIKEDDSQSVAYTIESPIDMDAIRHLQEQLQHKPGMAKLTVDISGEDLDAKVSRADARNPVTVVYVPACLRSTYKEKRATKQSKVSVASSFSSEEECNAKTNHCSGHGVCSKPRGMASYACKCENGFGGRQCQKQDISVQFQLFFWTAVVALVTIVLGIKLMMSVGDEPLPGVLGKQ